jgi:hypothetical protein
MKTLSPLKRNRSLQLTVTDPFDPSRLHSLREPRKDFDNLSEPTDEEIINALQDDVFKEQCIDFLSHCSKEFSNSCPSDYTEKIYKLIMKLKVIDNLNSIALQFLRGSVNHILIVAHPYLQEYLNKTKDKNELKVLKYHFKLMNRIEKYADPMMKMRLYLRLDDERKIMLTHNRFMFQLL